MGWWLSLQRWNGFIQFDMHKRHPGMRFGIPGLVIAALAMMPVISVAPVTQAQEIDFESMISAGTEWVRDNVPVDLLSQVQIPPPAEWTEFWGRLQEILDKGSLEDMADFMPYAEAGARLLERVPGGEDYAAWLRQRLDYLEMAGDVERRIPVSAALPVPPPRPPPVVTGRKVHLVPAKKPVVAAVPATVSVRRQAATQSGVAWKRKLAGRAAPVGAGALVPRLKAVFRQEGVPSELVWIAEVESTMNPNARNPGGAVGLFQFMPATAKRFGLRTFPIDERKHPEKSARAAAQYLRFLHGEFGSWPLAVAAFNAGEGRVQESLEKEKSGLRTFGAIGHHLPLETRMYVPKVEALVSLREGVDGLKLPAPRAEGRAGENVFAGNVERAPLHHSGTEECFCILPGDLGGMIRGPLPEGGDGGGDDREVGGFVDGVGVMPVEEMSHFRNQRRSVWGGDKVGHEVGGVCFHQEAVLGDGDHGVAAAEVLVVGDGAGEREPGAAVDEGGDQAGSA
jgi:membrane-bound lytic murein transglycosylase D